MAQRLLTSRDFTFDDQARVMTVAGVRYAYDLFAAFGMRGLRAGEHFEILRRERDGALTIRCLEGDSRQA